MYIVLFKIFLIFTELAHWADSVIESRCPYVCTSVGPLPVKFISRPLIGPQVTWPDPRPLTGSVSSSLASFGSWYPILDPDLGTWPGLRSRPGTRYSQQRLSSLSSSVIPQRHGSAASAPGIYLSAILILTLESQVPAQAIASPAYLWKEIFKTNDIVQTMGHSLLNSLGNTWGLGRADTLASD